MQGLELPESECRKCGVAMARKEGLIGRKVGMTQVFTDDGSHVPVTVIEAGPCTVIGIRTSESHGYDALQIGFGAKRKNVSKPAAGFFKKANVSPMHVVREVRLEKTEKLQGYQLGQALTVEMFEPGELIDVVGVTKGKGFQGGVKRHGWYGGDATHGSMFHRAPGSIGASSDPSRVWPGHHLPGRMGGDRRTVLNLSVVRVMLEQNLILVRGAVPGANGSLVMLRKSVKTKKAQQPTQKAVEKK
jgi:large subunit ribosomal protein L3